MTQSLLKEKQDFFSLPKVDKTTIDLVESIKNYIKKHDCPNLAMDISHLNVFDASKVTVVCSTYHWEKYPEGNISWKIASEDIKEMVSPLNLGNITLVTSQ